MLSDEAHAFVCRLRTDKVEAKYWCPSLVDAHGKSTVDGKTGADEILLALVRKLGGELTRSKGKMPEKFPTKNHKDAAMYNLSRRKGRPNVETAAADAAAKLIAQRGEQRVKSALVRAKRSHGAPPRLRAAKPALRAGAFTARGNPVTAPKATALVEVCPPPPRR